MYKMLNGKVISTTLLSKDTYDPMQKIIIRGTKGLQTNTKKETETKPQTNNTATTTEKPQETTPKQPTKEETTTKPTEESTEETAKEETKN